MKISVIIPVYNAERYVGNAVQSTMQQPEIGEVILIEDGSPDNCLQICRALEDQFDNVKLLRHPDGKNHGAGATRNLGIKHARYDYIAFLDADDFYLPKRFETAKKLFKMHDDIDGVYEAIGTHLYDPQYEQQLFSGKFKSFMTMRAGIDGENLFEALARGKNGFFSLDGLIVKRDLFERCGYFFDHLKLHQDTAIIIQMSLTGKLIPGRLDEPVAMRGVHGENRILSDYNAFQTRFLLWQTIFMWALSENLTTSRLTILFYNYCYSAFKFFQETKRSSHANWAFFRSLIYDILRHPILVAGAFFEHIIRRFYNSSMKNKKF
jgi:glycosyltransferase involved in cell wall biosynthesis